MHRHLLDNLHLATSVFMLGDLQAARALLAEKDRMRDLEQAAPPTTLSGCGTGEPRVLRPALRTLTLRGI
jgi:Na+/phosphate symporter